MFRGREQSRPELGFRLLQKLADDVTELGFVEAQPKQDGRNMIMVIGPHRRAPERKVEAKPAAEQSRPVPSPRSEAPAQADAAETPVEAPVETPVETAAPAPTDA
jgi:translation initiation factor IF-3